MNEIEPNPDPSTVANVIPRAAPTDDGQGVKWVGEYQLIRKIGGGGMGVVYDAIHARLKRRVAVKLLPEKYLTDETAFRRFLREMEAAGRLEHPHIVQASDAGVVNGEPYLVMEFVRGSDLARLIMRYGPLPPLAALEIMEQVSDALGHIHSHGMVHRDIKPSNLLLSRDGVVKVADLGLALLLHPLSEKDEITLTGEVIGTIDYMAPEQAQNSKLTDCRADIYSVGCCLHYLLCGVPVFGEGSRVDRLIAHRTGVIPDLASRCPVAIPRSLDRLYRDMLHKDPRRRPQSLQEVLARLLICRGDLEAQIARDGTNGQTFCTGRLSIDAGLRLTAQTLLKEGATPVAATGQQTTIVVQKKRGFLQRHLPVAGGLLLVAICLFGFWRVSRNPEHGAGFIGIFPEPATAPETPGETVPASRRPMEIDAHAGAVFNVHFSEDGRHLFSCGSDGLVQVWDVATGGRLASLPHDRGADGAEVIDVALIPHQDLVVTACYNGAAAVWDWRNNHVNVPFQRHLNRVEGVAWISGSRVLTTGRDDAIYVWDTRNPTDAVRLENSHTGGARGIAVSADGLKAITADYNGNVLIWNLEPGRERFEDYLPLDEPACEIWDVDWVGNTSEIVLCGLDQSAGESPLLSSYDVETRKPIREFKGVSGRVYNVQVSPDGARLFAAADEIYGWLLTSEESDPQFVFTHHRDHAFCVEESPDGTRIATGGADGTIRIVELRDLWPADSPSLTETGSLSTDKQ